MDSITNNDLEALKRRFVTPELAALAGLYRVDSIAGARLVGQNGAGDFSGLAIPYISPGDSHPREYRLRRDRPELDLEGRERRKYVSPPGRGNLLYFAPGTPPGWLVDITLPVAVVEGEFKALALYRLAHHETDAPRWLPVGIPGCWNWRGTVGKAPGPDGERRDVKGPIPDLDRIAWEGRTVYLVPDANYRTNDSVSAAWRELGKELERRGARCAVVDVPDVAGVNGVDDLLALWGPERVLELFASAEPRNAARDYHLTDLGNAERFVSRHGRNVYYVPARRSWYVWDGRRWRKDDTLEVEALGKETIRAIYQEVGRLQDREAREKLAKWAMASEADSRIAAMLRLARSDVAARAEDFDTDQDLLNFHNGTLHLPAGELRPHRRGDRITKLVDYEYRPEAECRRFLAFLAEILRGEDDPDRARRLTDYLQVALGYSMTGRTAEKAVFICHGSGDNGKTTLLELFRALLAEYSTVLQIETLMSHRRESNNAQADAADLQGARFAMTSETEEGHQLSAAKVKTLSKGMGQIRAARKYENLVTFPETHKLWLDCNHRPRVKDDGRAIWNRLHLIPFDVIVQRERQDRDLPAKLLQEAEGILAWAVLGARRWYEEGLKKPLEVEAATQVWREENDVLEAFLSECCIRKVGARVEKGELFGAYRAWCEESGVRPDAKNPFGTKLFSRGFDDYNDGNRRYWMDLGLMADTT